MNAPVRGRTSCETRAGTLSGTATKETDGRSAGALGVGDHEGSRELPRVRGAGSDAGRALARAHQGGGGAGQRRARIARRRHRRAHRPRRRRGGRRAARRPVPDRRLPDRFRHVVEHERQRGDRQSRGRGSSPERPREHGAVVERRVPVGGAPGGGRLHPISASSGAATTRHLSRTKEQRVRRFGQGRSHSHDGCGARDARAGVRRVRGADPAGPRSRPGFARARFADSAWRYGDGDRA